MPLTNYFGLTGGMNVTDSPLFIKDNQATNQSYNYDYAKTGSITKVLGHRALNTIADAQLRTVGLNQFYTTTGTTRTIIRAAGTKLQTLATDDGTTVNLAEDTTAGGTDFLGSGTTQQVVSAPFNASTGAVTWMAGGDMSAIYGYNGTKITKNGVTAPTTSSFTATPVGSGGTFVAGTYRWTLVFRKDATEALSNALTATEASATVVNNDSVTLAWTISNNDTVKYDQIWVYRSAISGSAGFTTGDLVAQLASTATGYLDTGSSIASSQNVPRAGGVVDNSELATATYKYITAFKRRLVTASDSTIYLSDLNKPESWPIANFIKIPSGGPITGLAAIGFNSPFSQGADEFLVIFKERELWILTGLDIDDWELKFVDSVGCLQQAHIVSFNGFLAWFDHRGIYMWDGAGKPIYCSRPIEALFAPDGDLDKTKLDLAWGIYKRNLSQIHWRVSHKLKGENALTIKMDIRLTSTQVSQQIDSRILEGVFSLDFERALYAGISFPASGGEEMFITGDASGFVYKMYNAISNPGSTGIQFSYETRPLDMGNPEQKKRYKKVIAWVERIVRTDLTLYYWTDFRQRVETRSKVLESMDPQSNQLAALWDVAIWDSAFWDDYEPDIGPVVFYLHANENNAEGDTLKLKFEQLDASAPVRIHGITIDWEPVGDTR